VHAGRGRRGIGDRWAGLAVDRADQLGGYRIGELTTALRALGVDGPVYLGGAGRWRDSGMAGTEPRGQRRFADADETEAVRALVAIIRELRPHVVVTYDPKAATATQTTCAPTPSRPPRSPLRQRRLPGEPWTVPKFYWTVFRDECIRRGPQRRETR